MRALITDVVVQEFKSRKSYAWQLLHPCGLSGLYLSNSPKFLFRLSSTDWGHSVIVFFSYSPETALSCVWNHLICLSIFHSISSSSLWPLQLNFPPKCILYIGLLHIRWTKSSEKSCLIFGFWKVLRRYAYFYFQLDLSYVIQLLSAKWQQKIRKYWEMLKLNR